MMSFDRTRSGTRAARRARWLAVAGLVGAALVAPAGAAAAPGGLSITLCHATNSDANPYVEQTVSVSSSGEPQGGHANHDGPVWNATLKDLGIDWGDIIPPYEHDGVLHPGSNWTAEGQAIHANGCDVSLPQATGAPTSEPTADPTAIPTSEPTSDPTAEPTTDPTPEPTGDPTPEPTSEPTSDPTTQPTSEPSTDPSGEPGADPTAPAADPTTEPTGAVEGVTGAPSVAPSGQQAADDGAPQVTLPPTDTAASAGAAPGSGSLRALLLAMAALGAAVLFASRRADRTA